MAVAVPKTGTDRTKCSDKAGAVQFVHLDTITGPTKDTAKKTEHIEVAYVAFGMEGTDQTMRRENPANVSQNNLLHKDDNN